MSYVCPRCRKMGEAFPSIHAELERVTAERDELLKGYMGMREAIREGLLFLEPLERKVGVKTTGGEKMREVLTSFPEIK